MKDRLNNTKIARMEIAQRKSHIDLIKKIYSSSNKLKMLSYSCGDGIWDLISLQNNNYIKDIIATDIVENPVKKEDIQTLKKYANWDFKKIKPETPLPFNDNEFDIVIHHDVLEHTVKPHMMLSEQYRVLKKGGYVLFGTPNLQRPMNIIKIMLGKLKFPVKIGTNDELGDYIHIQEFNEQQVSIMLKEIGFKIISIKHCYWGIHLLKFNFTDFPKSNIGKGMCHYLTFLAQK